MSERVKRRTWLMIGAAVLVAVALELITVAWGYPMSHAMADAPSIVVAAICLVAGVLIGHFWWPAKSRWRRLEALVAAYGPPHPADTLHRLRTYAAQLWDAYQGDANGPSGP